MGERKTSGEQNQTPDSGRAMAYAARLIDVSDADTAPCRGLGCAAVDSDAETEVEDGDGPPSSPSFIPETPLSEADAQLSEEEVSASQRRERADCDANVCAVAAAGVQRGDVQNTCEISARVPAVAVATVGKDGDDMEVEEEVDVVSVEVVVGVRGMAV